jgi:hypothetical protein
MRQQACEALSKLYPDAAPAKGSAKHAKCADEWIAWNRSR